MARLPAWQDWLQSAKLCERSMKFFEKPRIAAIKTLSKRIAQDSVLGHLRKAYHNLDLANKVFDMHEGEAAEIPLDFTPLTTITVTPYKKGLRERIPREAIEDLYIPVIEQQLRRLARRMAYQIDKDCMTVIDIAAGSSSAGTGKSLGATGTEFTITGGIGTKDLLWADAKIASYNFIADSLLCNPVNARDLKYLPQFSLYAQYGEPVIQSGAIGTVYGLQFFVSNVVPAGTAYVLSTGQNLSASYAPLGFFVIKRPLLTDIDIKKEFDAVDIVLSTRFAPVITCGEAISKITGLATT